MFDQTEMKTVIVVSTDCYDDDDDDDGCLCANLHIKIGRAHV